MKGIVALSMLMILFQPYLKAQDTAYTALVIELTAVNKLNTFMMRDPVDQNTSISPYTMSWKVDDP